MPFFIPFLVAGVAGLAAGALVKGARGQLIDRSPRSGYCTWCGKTGTHSFHEDGLSWSKSGPMGFALGGAGTVLLGLGTRNVFRCDACRKLTLPCRKPMCSGMARSGEFYDDELCGECFRGNNVDAIETRAEEARFEAYKLVRVLRDLEQRLSVAESELAARQGDAERIRALSAIIEGLRRERDRLRDQLRVLGAEAA